jgi:hypothetical protein
MRYANKTTSLRTIYLKDGTGIFLRRGESADVKNSDVLRISEGIVEVSDEAVISKPRKQRRSKTSETEESVSEENF